ncbi:MAG: hypothetical protein WC119_00845 [Synergistaceae bacterium]
MKKIELGSDDIYYQIEGSYTHIFDDEGEPLLTLRWAASETEIAATAYGFGAGRKIGIIIGRLEKEFEIKRVLGIVNPS